MHETVSLRGFFKQYRRDYALGIGCLLLTNLMGAAIPLQIKHVIDALQQHHLPDAIPILWIIGALIAGMFVVRVLSRFFLIGLGRKLSTTCGTGSIATCCRCRAGILTCTRRAS